MYLVIGKGFIYLEFYVGYYDFFVKNIWVILNLWLVECEVFGVEKMSL